MLSAWKITASQRNCSCELSHGKRSKGGQKRRFKDSLKVSLKSFGIVPNCPGYLAQNRELSNVERKYVKLEEMQQLICAGNLEKAVKHQPLLPPFLVLTALDSSAYRLISLAICALMDPIFNHKVDQMTLIDYNGPRRRYMCMFAFICEHITLCLYTFA